MDGYARRYSNGRGYVLVRRPMHQEADHKGYVREHRMVAEAALGHVLPPRAEVHHVNEDKSDNRGANLVICQDRAYHMLLHARLRALRACGHADWLLCGFCGRYDSLANLIQVKQGRFVNHYHRECRQADDRARNAAKMLRLRAGSIPERRDA